MNKRGLKCAADELQIVWGEVYAPDIPDTDGDFMSKEDIREMAYKFMKSRRLDQIDVQHNNVLVDGAGVVESFVARKNDPDGFIEGAWVAGVHIPDKDVWLKVKKGEINGFSMEAFITRTPAVIELNLPPVVRGKTLKAEDGHAHEFFVSYDEAGTFLGGYTSEVNGHMHEIKKGTITEPGPKDNHRHRFSFIEGMSAEVLRLIEEPEQPAA